MVDVSKTVKEVFRQKRIAIIGDLVADQYLNGTISRVSREAPVFILRHDETSTFPGAAANAAANVASLGAQTMAVGLVGVDANGTMLLERLIERGVDCTGIVADRAISTTTKVRILAGQQHAARQQVIRIDYENAASICQETLEALRAATTTAARTADAVIISDYNYGVAETDIFDEVRAIVATRGIPLLVDSRFRLGEFRGASAATPNQEEVEQLLGPRFDGSDCAKLREDLSLDALLITNGNKGMFLVEKDGPARQIDAVGSDQAVDVTGAGDTVIAVFALALASGLGYFDAAVIANHAGGIVVMKKGTAVVSPEELLASIQAYPNTLASVSIG